MKNIVAIVAYAALAAGFVVFAALAFAQDQGVSEGAPAQVVAVEQGSGSGPGVDSDSFCRGWNAAVELAFTRYQNFGRQVMVGRNKDDNSGAGTLLEGVGAYVLMPKLATKMKLDDSVEVDCTPKP